jgi:hypothetical protein
MTAVQQVRKTAFLALTIQELNGLGTVGSQIQIKLDEYSNALIVNFHCPSYRLESFVEPNSNNAMLGSKF